MLLGRYGIGISEITEPSVWLRRHDTDREFHDTIKRLLHPAGDARPRVAEAVLLLEQYIGLTAAVRSQVEGWGNDWEEAVRLLVNNRSVGQIRHVQHLLRTSNGRYKL